MKATDLTSIRPPIPRFRNSGRKGDVIVAVSIGMQLGKASLWTVNGDVIELRGPPGSFSHLPARHQQQGRSGWNGPLTRRRFERPDSVENTRAGGRLRILMSSTRAAGYLTVKRSRS